MIQMECLEGENGTKQVNKKWGAQQNVYALHLNKLSNL